MCVNVQKKQVVLTFSTSTSKILCALIFSQRYGGGVGGGSRGRRSNEMHQGENNQDFSKWRLPIFRSLSYNNLMNLRDFFPKCAI